MTKSQTYNATISFDEDTGQWAAELKEIPQVHTFGRPLKKVRERLREALALWLDDADAAESAMIVEQIAQDSEMENAIRYAKESRAEEREASKKAADWLQTAAEMLVERGYTMREAAELLEVSFQRIGQLLPEGSKRMPIVVAARKIGVTPAAYKGVLYELKDVYMAPNIRSVGSDVHERVRKTLAKR